MSLYAGGSLNRGEVYMKSRITVLVVLVTILAIFIPSCSLPLLRYGNGGTVTLALNGLVIPTASSDVAAGSRLILPLTTRIKVDVTGPDNFQKSAEAQMAPGAINITIDELPIDKELSFVISALDASGNALTKATATAVLQAGQNSLTATLKPDPAIVMPKMLSNITSNVSVLVDSTLTLAPGEYKLFKVEYMADTDTERQLQFDGMVVRWPWVRIYDENWTPLPVIASDEGMGWVVVNLPAGSRTVMVAVANVGPAGVFPIGQVTGQLSLRQSVFIDKNGTGSGTSQSPAGFDPLAFNGYAGKAVFLRAGTYLMNKGINISGFDSHYIYGGFGLDWKTRPGQTELLLAPVATETSAFSIGESSAPKVILDNIRIAVQDYGSVFQRTGVTVKNSATLRVYRSSIAGCVAQTPISVGVSLVSTGLMIEGGTVEIYASSIRGGFAGNSYVGPGSTVCGIMVVASGMYTLHVQSSVIDGGTAVTASGLALTSGIYNESTATSGLVLVNRSRVFGGIAQSTSGSVSAYGINAMNSSAAEDLIVYNSMVSGGQALGDTAGAVTYGLYTTENSSLCVAGNVIDTGRVLGTSGLRKVTGVYIDGTQNGNTAIVCNVFLSTGDKNLVYDASSAAISETNSNFVGGALGTVAGNTVVISQDEGYYNIVNYFYVGATDNSANYGFNRFMLTMGQKYSDVFGNFLVPAANSVFDRFYEWMNGNYWKIQPAFPTFTVNTTVNAVPVFVQTLLPNALPSLLFDLAGNPRPASGIWKIGAFE